MATSMPQNVSTGAGRALVIGGSIVALTLGGFYLNLRRMKEKETARGANPMFEQTIHHAHMHPDDSLPYPPLRAHASDIPPQFRTNEHHSGHATHRNYKDTPEYAEHGEAVRRMAPPPQRQAQDGTGRAYTKSPNYADNYGKTKRAAAVHAEA